MKHGHTQPMKTRAGMRGYINAFDFGKEECSDALLTNEGDAFLYLLPFQSLRQRNTQKS